MVQYARLEDKEEIRKLWNESFYNDNIEFDSYYFNNLFDPMNNFIIKEGNRIVSVGAKKKHVYMLHNRPVVASMIFGIATKYGSNNKGYMNNIVTTMLDHLQHQELFTLIQSYKVNAYEKYGFKPVYNRVKYFINNSNFSFSDISYCKSGVSAKDMLFLYATCMKRFNGYLIRDIEYFNNFIEQVKCIKGNIVGVYNKTGNIVGYATFIKRDNHIIIDEALYLSTNALFKILALALKLKDEVQLHLTVYENLDKYFVNCKKEVYQSTYVRINDFKLFNELFKTNVDNVQDAFNINKKPLFLNESI